MMALIQGAQQSQSRQRLARLLQQNSMLLEISKAGGNLFEEAKKKHATRSLAWEKTRQMRATFSKYDADGDGLLSCTEVLEYAWGEFNFLMPDGEDGEIIHRICRSLAKEEEAGVPFENFHSLKMAIGIERVLVSS